MVIGSALYHGIIIIISISIGIIVYNECIHREGIHYTTILKSLVVNN